MSSADTNAVLTSYTPKQVKAAGKRFEAFQKKKAKDLKRAEGEKAKIMKQAEAEKAKIMKQADAEKAKAAKKLLKTKNANSKKSGQGSKAAKKGYVVLRIKILASCQRFEVFSPYLIQCNMCDMHQRLESIDVDRCITHPHSNFCNIANFFRIPTYFHIQKHK